jgi:hypothetical protein
MPLMASAQLFERDAVAGGEGEVDAIGGVDGDLFDTANFAQSDLHAFDAGGAVHAFDFEGHLQEFGLRQRPGGEQEQEGTHVPIVEAARFR